MKPTTLFAASCALAVALPCCSPAQNALPSRCAAIAVDPLRELLVTDADVVASPALDFAHVMGDVVGQGAVEGDVAARSWMDAWSAAPGEDTLGAEVTSSWAPSSDGGLDLSRAPFELIAISDRIDLSTLGAGRVGEVRFVYGLVVGGARRPLTVIVELQLPPTRTPTEWATAWHALGSLEGDANHQAVLDLVGAVLAEPLRGQVRTQDARGATPVLLEFDLGQGGPLVPAGLFNEPASDLDATDLTAFVSAHEDEVLAGTHVLPAWMLAPSTTAVTHAFALNGVPSDVAEAFTNATCSGCHTGEPTVDGSFHVSPLRRGTEALSPFLLDPSGAPDELGRRADVLRGLVCGS